MLMLCKMRWRGDMCGFAVDWKGANSLPDLACLATINLPLLKFFCLRFHGKTSSFDGSTVNTLEQAVTIPVPFLAYYFDQEDSSISKSGFGVPISDRRLIAVAIPGNLPSSPHCSPH